MKIYRVNAISNLNDEYLHWSMKQKNYRLANMFYAAVHNAWFGRVVKIPITFEIENDKFNH